MKLWDIVKDIFGFPTEAKVFKDFAKDDKGPYVKGTPGPVLEALSPGQYFAVVGKENYPKVILKGGGYYDLSFQIKHMSPDPHWKTVLYTEEQVREIFRAKGFEEKRIDVLLKQRRTIVHDGEI